MLTSQRGLSERSEDLWITHRDILEIEGADSFFGVRPKVNREVKVIEIRPAGSVHNCCLSSFGISPLTVKIFHRFYLISDAQCFQKR